MIASSPKNKYVAKLDSEDQTVQSGYAYQSGRFYKYLKLKSTAGMFTN